MQVGKGEVVLIVDDSPPLRRLMVAQLAALGYSPLEAETASVALDMLRNQSRVDVLLTDVIMPGGIDGLQLANEAVGLRPRLKVVLTSGYPLQISDPDATGAKGHTVLRKPFRKDAIGKAISDALESA